MIAVLGVLAALSVGGCGQTTFTFVQMSDPQIGFRDKTPGYVHTDSLLAEAVRNVNSNIYNGYLYKDRAYKASFVIITGDLVNDQKDALQDSIYRANRAKIKVPVYEIPGNHDIRPWTPENHSNYLALRGYDRFSFRYKGCAFIGIDSNCIIDAEDSNNAGSSKESNSARSIKESSNENLEAGGENKKKNPEVSNLRNAAEAEAEQLEWLTAQLQRLSKRNSPKTKVNRIFVFLHCPVILKDIDEENGYFNFPKGKREKYIALFKKYGVDVVFAGHTHMEYDTAAEGIRFVTAGPVGSPLGRGYSGYEVVTVSKSGINCSYVPINGKVSILGFGGK